MKIFLKDQSANFNTFLSEMIKTPVMGFEKKSLKEKVSSIDIRTQRGLEHIDLDFFFQYKIFPSTIMTYLTQWEHEGRKMKVGDTIVQQTFIPPAKSFSQKIIFGVRITELINAENKLGFSYQTLQGHVEKGESTFTIEQQDGGLSFKVHTFSKPGNFLTSLLGPIFSTPYQGYCTRKALENVKRQILK